MWTAQFFFKLIFVRFWFVFFFFSFYFELSNTAELHVYTCMPTSAKVAFLDPSKVNVSKNSNMSYRYDIIDRCLTSKIIIFVIGVSYLSGGIFTLKNNKFLQEYIIVPLGKTIFL